MDACSLCPHANDCLKAGSCLDELNAPFIKINQTRLMTPKQASAFMAAMREGKTLRWITNGDKFGPVIVSLQK